MKQFLVISGKEGTGNSVIVGTSGSLSKGRCIFVDCDVDAADLRLLLHPQIVERHIFRSGKLAYIDEELCVHVYMKEEQ